jgi:hypothetical protein
MRHIVGVTPSWPARSFIRFLNRRANGVFSGCSGGFGGSAGRERSAFSHNGELRIVCGDLFRRAGALRPVIVRGLSVLFRSTLGFMVGTMPRLSTSVLCISGGPPTAMVPSAAISGISVISIQSPSSMNDS